MPPPAVPDGAVPAYDVLIVGGGHGGAQAAVALRQQGFTGTVAIVGDEPDPPYERPPLSKDYLAGTKPFARLLIRPEAFWAERGVELLLGRRVAAVDAVAHRVATEDGRAIGYRHLLWAAGGRARRLACAGHDLAGLHAIRTRADVDRLLAELDGAGRVVVVGGGYVGLEAAAALRKRGVAVTVVEAQPRLLARVAGAALADFYAAEHRAHGVDLRLGATVAGVEGRDGRAAAVRLASGELLPADLAIVGIGIVPAVEPLLAAGAAGDNGVWVDDQCRTTLPDIWAVGDCAAHRNAFADGARLRLESVQNANDQANVAAAAIAGRPATYHAVPWFWSNQYDLRLQTVGLAVGHDMAVVRGEPAARSFTVVYLRNGRVAALDCVNATRDYIQGKRLVEAGATVDPARLADAGVPLKEMA